MKNNNHGQVFVLFVIMLPLILLLIMVFINKTFLYYEKAKLNNLLNLTCESDDMNKFIKNNDPSVKLDIKTKDGKIILDAKKKINNTYVRIKKVCEE